MSWVHQDPVTKSQRITNSSGTVVSTVDLDPFGGDTSASANAAFQPHRYTSYERDVNGADDAMMRRYNRYWGRFDQPDPYDGSYDASNPQSFNRYAYVNNDPVNFVDPSGLNLEAPDGSSRPQPLTGNGIFSPGIHIGWGLGSTGVNDLSGPGVIDPFGRTSVPFNFVFIVGGVFGSGGGSTGMSGGGTGGGPQNTDRKIKQVTECKMFANFVAGIASEFSSAYNFVNALWDQFAQDKDRNAWGSTGFKDAFKDDVGPGNSPNQVRHYVGGLWAGYTFGIGLGHAGANLREVSIPDTLSHKADRALNAVSTAHGVDLLKGTVKPGDLYFKILADVCK